MTGEPQGRRDLIRHRMDVWREAEAVLGSGRAQGRPLTPAQWDWYAALQQELRLIDRDLALPPVTREPLLHARSLSMAEMTGAQA